MSLFKVRLFYDNSTTIKRGESVYLIQGDDIYSIKDKFINNSWTLHEEFDIPIPVRWWAAAATAPATAGSPWRARPTSWT